MLINSNEYKTSDLCQLLIDASIDQVLAIDTQWQIIAWNRTSENISGIPRAEILGKYIFDVFPSLKEDDETEQAFRLALEGNKSFLLPDHKFEHRKYYENHIIPLKKEDGILIGVMKLMHDVSHRIKGEVEMQKLHAALKDQYNQLEKTNAELAIFTSITGKDLKEPVRRLYTALEMLMRSDGKNLSDNSRAGLRRMQASLTKISLLLDDVLAFSSAMSFDEKFVKLDLNEVLKAALEALSAKIAHKKAVVESQQLPIYTGSAEMLHYLFYNIIDNALKFQPAENIPVINIASEIITNENNAPGNEKPERRFLRVSFTDNGTGFPAEDSKRIFKMFERLQLRKHFAGAGIGLTISQKIAEAHGGYIEAENSGANGAIFHCYFALRSHEYQENEV